MDIEIETVTEAFTTGLPVFTALTAGGLMLLQMLLMIRVGRLRGQTDTMFGDGDAPRLQLAIRAHGNLTENASLFLLVFAFLEMLGAATWAVATLCGVFFVARLLHAVGLSGSAGLSRARIAGATGTLLTGLLGGIYLTVIAFLEIIG